MIKFETTPTPSGSASADVHGFAAKHGLNAKEAARIFLKLGPSASSEDIAAETKLYAIKSGSSGPASKKAPGAD
jgi:hypothetical protein